MKQFSAPKDEVDSKRILAVLLVVVLCVGILALHAVTFMVLWNWHVAPLGVKEINAWHALGLICVAGALRRKSINKDDDLDDWRWMKFGAAVPLFLLAIGYLAKEMM